MIIAHSYLAHFSRCLQMMLSTPVREIAVVPEPDYVFVKSQISSFTMRILNFVVIRLYENTFTRIFSHLADTFFQIFPSF